MDRFTLGGSAGGREGGESGKEGVRERFNNLETHSHIHTDIHTYTHTNTLTVHVEGDGGAFPGGDSQVTGHTAVVPPCVCVHWVDGQEAVGRHPLPVWEHLLM